MRFRGENDFAAGAPPLIHAGRTGQHGTGGAGRQGRCQVGSGKGATPAWPGLLLPPAWERAWPREAFAPTALDDDSDHGGGRATYRNAQDGEAHPGVVVAATGELRSGRSRASVAGGVGATVEERRGRGYGEARRSMGDA